MYPLRLLTLTLFIITTNIICVTCAPAEAQPPQNAYDYSKFTEVYDQRQNGSENYKVDVNGVVVVWSSPESALSALLSLDPALFEGDYSDLEELLGAHKPPKPENLLVISPEKPSSSTTTSLPPTESQEVQAQNNTARHENVKRKYVVPALIKSFLARRKL